MNHDTILVVEDNPLNQKLVIRFLEAKGFEVTLAGTTAQAEAAIASRRPGLLLLDVSLPGEDGLTWVRRLRAGGDTKLPILALTAHAMPGDREIAMEAGCNEYLTKPIDLSALLRQVLVHVNPRPKEAAR